MKKITLLLVFVLTCYGYTYGQLFSIKDFSETECSRVLGNGSNLTKIRYIDKVKGDTLRIYMPKTLEDCFSMVDKMYGEEETQKIINMIDNEGEILTYIDVLIEEGMIIKAFIVRDVYDQLYNYSMSFVENGQVYTLTYEPAIYPKGQSYVYGKRKLYLYQRIGHNQWVKVSDVVQVDDNQYPYDGNVELVDPIQTSIRTFTLHYDRDANMGFGSVDKLENDMVVMFVTNIINHKKHEKTSHKMFYFYNDIILFIPQSDGTYDFVTYTPLNHETRFPDYVLNDDGVTVTGNEIKIETSNPNTKKMNSPIVFKPTFNGIECEGCNELQKKL